MRRTTSKLGLTQLNGIPDKLIIFVRKTNGSLTCCDADNYLTIENIRNNFNNQAGLLSSMTPEQLYANSVLSGLANMSYEEFRGITMSVSGRADQLTQSANPYSGLGAKTLAGGRHNPRFNYVPTTGTTLVLNFAEVIQLIDEFYAPG